MNDAESTFLERTLEVGSGCPRCHGRTSGADVLCAGCHRPYHAECWGVTASCARCGSSTHFLWDLPARPRGSDSRRKRPPLRGEHPVTAPSLVVVVGLLAFVGGVLLRAFVI